MAEKLPDWAKPGVTAIYRNGTTGRTYAVEIIRTTATSAYTAGTGGRELRWTAYRSSHEDSLQLYGTKGSWNPSKLIDPGSRIGKLMLRDAQWEAEVSAAWHAWAKDPSIANTEALRLLLDRWAMSKQAEEVSDGTGKDV